MNRFSTPYTERTRGILYSYLISLPLLILYEVLIRISQAGEIQVIRISVDIWFQTVFRIFGIDAISATFFLAALAGAAIVFYKRSEWPHLKTRYFAYMLLESLVYAVLVAFLIGTFLGSLLQLFTDNPLYSLNKLQLVALSLGAGLYEELFFRVILVGFFLYLFGKFFDRPFFAHAFAAVLAALIFSSVHYVGEFGDIFTLNSFLFRFLFGLALNVIYVTRGFGIAAWTHAIYDLLVVLVI